MIPNALLKRFLLQVMQFDNLQALTAPQNHNFHNFLRRSGNKEIFKDDSIDSIIEYLYNGSPPIHLIVREGKVPQDPSQRQMNSYGGQRSHHSYNCPIFTDMNMYPQDNVIDADDATIVDGCWSKDDSSIANGPVNPILASLNASASTYNVDQLIMKAISSFR